MSVNLKRSLAELRSLVEKLEERCSEAEALNEQLTTSVAQKEERIKALEDLNGQLETKYKNLQTGLLQGGSPDEVEHLRDRFLCMVREIDDCIAKLNS